MAPSPAAAPPGSLSAPLPTDSPAVAVIGLPASSAPPMVAASSYDSSFSSPIHSTWLFCLHSLQCLYRLRGTSLLLRCFSYALACPLSFISSFLPLLPLPLLHPLSLTPPPRCRVSFTVRPFFSPLPSYPHLCRLLGSYIRLFNPSRLPPLSQLLIFPVMTKMSAIGRAGTRHAGRWQADLRRTGSDLTGPSPLWGTA